MAIKNNYRLFGIIAVVLAIISGLAENVLYGNIDANGVLHDSFFLPLTYVFATLGIALIAGSFFTKSRK